MLTRTNERSVPDALTTAKVRQAFASGEVRRLRIAARLSQADIAATVGVTGMSVCAWETGRGQPHRRCIAALAELLDELRDLTGSAA